MYHGILNVYKEAGFTSHDVVAKLRGICKQKKIGHTGTLDPDAVGVLPVCLGAATGLCEMLTDKTKEYEAVLCLGVITDTQDASGQILEEHEVNITKEEAIAAVYSFAGEYSQIPPMYSAVKVNGKKLYELAREGREIERKARVVTIEKIEITAVSLPELTMKVTCSKGTYIRTLCHDIGTKLQTGAIMKSLKRTRSGDFRIEDALTLKEIEELAHTEKLSDRLVKVDAPYSELKGAVVRQEYQKYLQNGNKLSPGYLTETLKLSHGEQVRIYNYQEKFYGVFAFNRKDNALKPVRMFFTDC